LTDMKRTEGKVI